MAGAEHGASFKTPSGPAFASFGAAMSPSRARSTRDASARFGHRPQPREDDAKVSANTVEKSARMGGWVVKARPKSGNFGACAHRPRSIAALWTFHSRARFSSAKEWR